VKECPRKFQASNLELTAAWSMDSAELSTLLLPGHSSATSRHAQFLERVCLPPYSNAELGLLRANFKKAQLSQSLSNFSLRTLLPNHK
jgi:hypothetical protein